MEKFDKSNLKNLEEWLRGISNLFFEEERIQRDISSIESKLNEKHEIASVESIESRVERRVREWENKENQKRKNSSDWLDGCALVIIFKLFEGLCRFAFMVGAGGGCIATLFMACGMLYDDAYTMGYIVGFLLFIGSYYFTYKWKTRPAVISKEQYKIIVKEENRRYNHDLSIAQTEEDARNKERPSLEQKLKEAKGAKNKIQGEISANCDWLDIPYKYRNYSAIRSIEEYIITRRCTHLEGVDGAYNLYEQEMKAREEAKKTHNVKVTFE